MKIVWEFIKGAFLCVVSLLCLTIGAALVYGFLMIAFDSVYQTDDIADYKNIKGNYDNETPAQFVDSFFPEQIDPAFSDLDYHYYARRLDGYGFEIYLEFKVNDTEEYESYKKLFLNQESVQNHSENNEEPIGIFNSCEIADELILRPSEEDYSVISAKWGRILYSDSTQQFVFVGIGVCDGGGTRMSELSYFFDRFDLDPVDFVSEIWQ